MKSVAIRNVIIGKGSPKICVPIIGITEKDIIEEVKNAMILNIDLIEWRADWYESCFNTAKVIEILKEIRKYVEQVPILFTFRTAKEGGAKEITIKEYETLLCAIIESKQADMVDIELFIGEDTVIPLLKKAKQFSVKTVLSSHDFEKTPKKQEIIARLCRMQELGGDITKIAVMPRNQKDVLTLLCATEQMQSQYADRPFITMSMGGLGSISRMIGEVFGVSITFGAGEHSSAPGQIEVQKLKQILEIVHDSI